MINDRFKLKVCGMREPGNISEVAALKPDYMGFIFHFKSSRFVEMMVYYVAQRLQDIQVEPVAVFVNPSPAYIMHIVGKYGFTHIQLHGKETPQTCADLKAKGLHIFKAFSIGDAEDIQAAAEYEGTCDYYLFDTKSSLPGGSGEQFNWDLLQEYKGQTPFFLSGGIGPDDAERIRTLYHPKLAGIDVNSKFEIRPAFKNVSLLSTFIRDLER